METYGRITWENALYEARRYAFRKEAYTDYDKDGQILNNFPQIIRDALSYLCEIGEIQKIIIRADSEIEVQDKYNKNKVWIIKHSKCGHYYINQKICGQKICARFQRVPVARIREILG